MNINFKERTNFLTLKKLETINNYWFQHLNKFDLNIEVYNNLIILKKQKFMGSSKFGILKFDLKNKKFSFILKNNKLITETIKFEFEFKTIYNVLLFKNYGLKDFFKNHKLEYLNNIFCNFEKELALF